MTVRAIYHSTSMISRGMNATDNLLARLRIQHPVILAPMAGGPSTPELVAAVSNAGGLGSIGAAYLAPEEITRAIAAVRRLTSKPFAVNLFAGGWDAQPTFQNTSSEYTPMLELLGGYHRTLGLPAPALPAARPSPFDAQLLAVLAAGVPVFSFTFGVPKAETLAALKARGVMTMGTATTVAEARALEAAGVDAVVAQGSEAGAHRGTFLASFEASMVGTMALVPQIVDAVSVPVVASGGIMDGRGVAAARALGAAAVQLGTAFVACDESGASESHKAALLAAHDDATEVTRAYSGRPARGLLNRFMMDVHESGVAIPPFPIQNDLTRPMRAAAIAQGDAGAFNLWAGQAASMSRRGAAGALVSALIEEAEEVVRSLASGLPRE